MIDAGSERIVTDRAIRTGSVSTATSTVKKFTLEEASIADIQSAMSSGVLSSVELCVLYLNRIFAYDANGMKLNSIPVLNPEVLAEAAEADRLRAKGIVLSALHGVPFTVKDSYKVKGLTVAAGSPAFAQLISNEDSFVVERIRAAGGVLVGKTNMPPLAIGGMQRGLYGRAESPYNADYLTAAWSSGSSNGAGTATAANFAAFGLGVETTSSGRSPASNNALVAYTPSRGLISLRGNWPLFPIKDVVVPMTRTMEDLFAVLDVIVVVDPTTTGDLWRDQTAIKLPSVDSVRPSRYATLARPDALCGKRIGVPTMYISKDYSGSAAFSVRPSILALWEKAANDLRALGATLIEVDFELMHTYEQDRVITRGPVERGLLPAQWWRFCDYATAIAGSSIEYSKLNPFCWEQFLRGNADPNLSSWHDVDVTTVFPHEAGSVDAKRHGPYRSYEAPRTAIVNSYQAPSELSGFAEALAGAERFRKVDFEDWLVTNNLDALVFPAIADIGRANSDVDETSYDHANSNGVRSSNTNIMLRHLGIPSVSVSMGIMADIGMPVNLTFIGPAYADNDLLSYAYAYEQATHNRRPPTRVPPLADETIDYTPGSVLPPTSREHTTPPTLTLSAQLRPEARDGAVLNIAGTLSTTQSSAELRVYVNGRRLTTETDDKQWNASIHTASFTQPRVSSAEHLTILALAKNTLGDTAAALKQIELVQPGINRVNEP
jgi:amidase